MASPASELMSGVFEIVMAIVGIALIALLINRSKDTATVVQSGASALDRLLRTVTLQNMTFGSY
jgi:hypothetical protein